MTIIEIKGANGPRRIERQSHRSAAWLEGYIEVPARLEAKAWETCGCCDLTIEDGKLVGVTPTERPAQEPTAAKQIAELKADLEATDYQIIKCSEYQLAGIDVPYDIAKLHSERQALRDQINALEAVV